MSSVIRFVPRHLRTSKEGMAAWLYGASERVRAASDREYARTGFPTTGRRFRLHDTAQRMRDAADWLMDVASAAAGRDTYDRAASRAYLSKALFGSTA